MSDLLGNYNGNRQQVLKSKEQARNYLTFKSVFFIYRLQSNAHLVSFFISTLIQFFPVAFFKQNILSHIIIKQAGNRGSEYNLLPAKNKITLQVSLGRHETQKCIFSNF